MGTMSLNSAHHAMLEKMMQVAVTIAIMVLSVSNVVRLASAADPDPVQDFCIGDPKSSVTVNGLPCKNPKDVTNADFVSAALERAGNTSSVYTGCAVTMAFAPQFPGINTQGISMARLDFAKNGGLNAPHWHPRASEILFVVNGTLLVGFVDTTNRLWSSVLPTGGVTFFPRGLLHFQLNLAKTPALAIVALNSQNPGREDAGPASFGSNIPDVVLQKTFNLTKEAVDELKAFFKKVGINGNNKITQASESPLLLNNFDSVFEHMNLAEQ